MIESPSAGVPEQVSRWDLMRTETCSGRKVFLVCPLVYGQYLVFIEQELGLQELQGAHKLGGMPYELVALTWPFWPPPESSRVSCGPRKIIKKFRFVWTPFGIDSL